MKLLLSLCILLISTVELISQCTPASADNCEDAPVLCSLDEIDGYTCTTTDYSNPTGCNPLCPGSTDRDHNMSWWAFVTEGGNACLTVTSANCLFKNGIQVGITQACDCSKAPIACDATCPGLGQKVICANLEPCKTYFLFVDGCGGDYCDFTIKTSGGKPPTANNLTSIDGETILCIGQCNSYQVQQTGTCSAVYLWALDGQDLGEYESKIDLEWPNEGTFELCVKAIIGNPASGSICSESNLICKTIIVKQRIKVLAGVEYVCDYKFPFYWGQTFIANPGIYTRRFKGINCCEVDSTKEFIGIPDNQKPCSEDAYITGRVFLDIDKNSVYSQGDQLLDNYLVYSPTSNNSSFSVQGIYKLNMLRNTTNEVKVQLINPNYYTSIPQFYNVVVGNQTGLLTGFYDFAIQSTDVNDLKITVAGSLAVPGTTTLAAIIITNDGILSNGQTKVSFEFPPNWQFKSTNEPNYVLNNNTLSWIIPTPVHPNRYIIMVNLFIPATEVIGSSYRYLAKVENALDINLANNNAQFEDILKRALDPNDKLVNYKLLTENFEDKGSELIYTIRFQNVGNLPAKDVFVYDTIGKLFDPKTIRMIASSHPCLLVMDELGYLKFEFLNINLPDTSVGWIESQGFVQYSILTLPKLDNGTILKNKATIIFEDLEGITTNEAITQVVISNIDNKSSDSKFKIYPNPVSDELYVHLPTELSSNYSLDIVDLHGKKIKTQSIKNSDLATINVKSLPNGVYILNILMDGNKIEGIRFVKY